MVENITNTVIVLLTLEELSNDELFDEITTQINQLIKTESVEFIKLPSFQRILITFHTHTASKVAYDWLKSHDYKVTFSVVDSRIGESAFLQLPDLGKKYVISPPPSPPLGWVDKLEHGPDARTIHDPKELTGLLFERLGDRIGLYKSEDDIEDSQSVDAVNHEDFINSKGELEAPQVLLERHNGNAIIVLDPAPDLMKSQGTASHFKTARPPL